MASTIGNSLAWTASAHVKKIKGFEAWFFTGTTKYFGHSPAIKKRKK